MIDFEEFKKLDMRIGTVIDCEKVEGSEKLLKLIVDMGGNTSRQIIAGIGKAYLPEELKGRQLPILTNLKPRMIFGFISQGMVLCADDGSPAVLSPDRRVESGSIIR